MLARVGLAELAERPLSVLSGGELRRVLLAHAIDPLPELLLLDEPASGLDERAIVAMESILQDLRREAGLTVLMVSHDLGQVRRLADRVTVLNRTVQRDGPPAEVLTADLPEILLAVRLGRSLGSSWTPSTPGWRRGPTPAGCRRTSSTRSWCAGCSACWCWRRCSAA